MRIDIQEMCVNSQEMNVDIQEMSVDIQEMCVYIQEMNVDIQEITVCFRWMRIDLKRMNTNCQIKVADCCAILGCFGNVNFNSGVLPALQNQVELSRERILGIRIISCTRFAKKLKSPY